MDTLIGERELEILHELWRAGPSTVAEVRDRLRDALAYTTVLTTLRNLEAKSLVTHEVEGRVHRFAAAVPATVVHQSAVTRLLRTVFRGDALRLVTSLVEREALGAPDLRALAAMVEARDASATASTRARPGNKRAAGSAAKRDATHRSRPT
jgi:BlaI family transcriptional regulator, penicillinase repressor